MTAIDHFIIALYFCAYIYSGHIYKRTKRSAICLVLFCICASTFNEEIPISDFYAYSFYSCIYATAAYYFIKTTILKALPISLFSISAYDLIFAIDSYYNKNIETWVWLYHEYTITVLHLVVLLVLVEKHSALVDAMRSNIHQLFCSVLCFVPCETKDCKNTEWKRSKGEDK